MKILSFDPGLGLCGFALSVDFEIKLYGVLETLKTSHLNDRLADLDMMIVDLIVKFKPNVIVAEKPILTMGGSNSAIVNYAYAMLLLRVSKHGYNDRFIEYSSKEVKKQVTGDGKADKKQVLDDVRLSVKLPPVAANFKLVNGMIDKTVIKNTIPDDAIDAVAVNQTYILNLNKSS